MKKASLAGAGLRIMILILVSLQPSCVAHSNKNQSLNLHQSTNRDSHFSTLSELTNAFAHDLKQSITASKIYLDRAKIRDANVLVQRELENFTV